MIGCGTAIYTDPDDYRANVPGANIDVVLTDGGAFKARVTWIDMWRLSLVLVEEPRPRIACLSFVPASAFVSFPLGDDPSPVWPSPVWNGVKVRRGDIVFHGRGEVFHQRTAWTARWGLISLSWEDLAAYGRALLGVELRPPRTAKFLRPPSRAMADLLRLHRQACRLAGLRPDVMARREVARALEQDLVHALVNCLMGREPRDGGPARQRHAAAMAGLERILGMQGDRPLSIAELSAGTGVSQRALRACCAAFVGMSPSGYARLRRLNLVHQALLRSDPATASVGTIARQYGFCDLGRFAAAYRAMFGEVPSVTLRDRRFRDRAGGDGASRFVHRLPHH
jgi:AraC-like DNA-binding protein